MKKYILLIVFLMIPSMLFASSNDLSIPNQYTQDKFRGLTRELGVAVSYIPMAPAEALATGHFDAGLEVSLADIAESKEFWKQITHDSSAPSFLPFPKIHLQAGLPFNINVGGIYTQVPGSNIRYWGGEIKWAFMPGSSVMPAVAVRGTYTGLSGVKQLNLHTESLDVSISKGFLNMTPYAGAGVVFVQNSAKNIPFSLSSVNITQPKVFVGTKFTVFLMNLVAEVDIANIQIYSLRLNFGF